MKIEIDIPKDVWERFKNLISESNMAARVKKASKKDMLRILAFQSILMMLDYHEGSKKFASLTVRRKMQLTNLIDTEKSFKEAVKIVMKPSDEVTSSKES